MFEDVFSLAARKIREYRYSYAAESGRSEKGDRPVRMSCGIDCYSVIRTYAVTAEYGGKTLTGILEGSESITGIRTVKTVHCPRCVLRSREAEQFLESTQAVNLGCCCHINQVWFQ